MRKLTLKLLYLIATIKHPKIRKDYRYFIRDNYYCRLRQIKFLIKDTFIKTPYKVIEFQGEFDQELRYVLPFAYWHHLNGTLKKTISCKNTKDFYFFSENHEERHNERIWQSAYGNYDVPNMTHSISFSYKKWKQIPFKAYYKNDIFRFAKPILVIANKYNKEWDQSPINYFSLPMLSWIIENYSGKYQIVYNRPLNTQIAADNSENLDLNDHKWLHDHHPEVIQVNDLYNQKSNGIVSFNQLQLLIYANCRHFISAHGGTAALASCFGGHNIILSKRGIEHELNEFETIFPQLSGARIHHAHSDEQIKGFMDSYY